MLCQLFTNCAKAYNLLQTDQDIKQRWIHTVRWLRDQLERQNHIPSNYSYQSQGQISSNDIFQGYFLERTPSAKSENNDIGSNSDEGDEN
ncbi:unnamed protein product [Rotaria sp. Silwood2]|nr:unnamed protein product [Rotaria sp. Silwood2]CAF2989636.1 unnamed protein product [Rotaria sp. Silwood2]CAF3310177.1 unnamed protein product [Rotaria sp. Silwood2]CAF4178836.1 unnamed protein product [Rotaria sp. Silwood2]CAF4333769.1 unnamed protein product [Rotaria sp. Silwood2]